MRLLIALILSMPAWAQFGAATQVVNGNGAPNVAYCANANNVGMVYARKDGEAANTTFYVCSNTGVATYAWALLGGSSGSGDVVGPASAVDGNIAAFDSTTGKLIKDSAIGTAAGGHIIARGTSPTITSGFGTTPSIAGKDAAGRVTVGTGGTAATGTITFGTAWTTAPVCTAANETTQLALFPTATTTTLVLASSTPFTAADKLVYICVGY